MTHAARAHSDVSPSGAERWWNCPGSVALLTKLRKLGLIVDRVNVAAERGTAGHELLEKCFKTGQHPVAFKREKFNGITPDQEILDAVEFAFEYVNTMRADRFYDAKIESEQYVYISAINCDTATDDGGTIDVAIVPVTTSGPNAVRTLIVLDYKQGRQPVSAERNKQLLLYACGLQEKAFWFYDQIIIGIVQPRSMDGVQFSMWECTAAELAAFDAEARLHYAATQQPNAPRIPGEKQCQWCEAKPHCPELVQVAMDTARQDFSAFTSGPVTEQPLAIELAFGKPTEIANAYKNLWLVEEFIKIVNGHVYTMLAKGDTSLGLKLVHGKSNRRWKHEPSAIKSLTDGGFNPDDFAPRALAGLGAIEKLLKARTFLPAAEREKWFKMQTEKPLGAPTIAPLDDPRPRINSPELDFKGISNDDNS